jgi:hypothetical protein
VVKVKTIVFDNLRDVKTGKVLKAQVSNAQAKELAAIAQMARRSSQEFLSYGFARN